MFNDNTHHKCASIVGRLNLQVPSIAIVVTVGRSRQSTSNDHCSDNWNTFDQVNVINTSSLNKSYVGGRMQIGHNHIYFAPNQVSENWTIAEHLNEIQTRMETFGVCFTKIDIETAEFSYCSGCDG